MYLGVSKQLLRLTPQPPQGRVQLLHELQEPHPADETERKKKERSCVCLTCSCTVVHSDFYWIFGYETYKKNKTKKKTTKKNRDPWTEMSLCGTGDKACVNSWTKKLDPDLSANSYLNMKLTKKTEVHGPLRSA